MSEQGSKLIYVCAPLKGDIGENIRLAREYCKIIIQQGDIPYSSHIMLDGLLDDNKPEEREKAIQIGLEMVLRCDKLYVFGDRISAGMKKEIEAASRERIPIMFMGSESRLNHEATLAQEKKAPQPVKKYSEYIKEQLSEQKYIECIESLKAEPDAEEDEEYPDYEEWKKEIRPEVTAEARELRKKGLLK